MRPLFTASAMVDDNNNNNNNNNQNGAPRPPKTLVIKIKRSLEYSAFLNVIPL
jgi:hypothetical protein